MSRLGTVHPADPHQMQQPFEITQFFHRSRFVPAVNQAAFFLSRTVRFKTGQHMCLNKAAPPSLPPSLLSLKTSIRALAARRRAAADAAARGDTPIPRLVRQKARRNRVGLTRIQDKSEPRRGRKAVATNSGLLSRRESRAGVLKRHTCKRRRPTISLSLNPSAPHHYPISRLLQQAPTAPRQVSNLGSKFFARNC